jgi:SAM-dependent methyltransferase
MRILELGAGTPYFSLAMSRRGYRMLASDADREVVQGLRDVGLEAELVDVEERLPFLDGEFRAVVMGELVEHIFDTRALLANCSRVLGSGGILALTTPNLATLQDRIRFLFGNTPRQVSPLHEYLSLHIRPFCRQSLHDVLRSCGFVGIECTSNYVVWRRGEGHVAKSRTLARWFPQLGGSLIMTATKGHFA